MNKNHFHSNIEAGSKESNEPRLLGSIISEMLHGQSPLARGYRQYIASQENGEAETQSWHTNTALAVNLKTILRSDRYAKTGKSYSGVLRRDEPSEEFNFDEHYTFIETLPTTEKRNPRIFNGRFITVTRRDDGSLRLNFKNLDSGSNSCIERYADGVRKEICQALKGLVEES